ncbi:cuticle collagen 7-like [Penaeus monodon]|uniref:cuticle collagen 7-like n=1 Tax=Penaeus monodon TaxID=6687 RepID=UPI0018A72589|nr:cuticle collagen 7-like [Penaeus monodon]
MICPGPQGRPGDESRLPGDARIVSPAREPPGDRAGGGRLPKGPPGIVVACPEGLPPKRPPAPGNLPGAQEAPASRETPWKTARRGRAGKTACPGPGAKEKKRVGDRL